MRVLLQELLEDPRILSATHAEKSELLEKELAIFQTARELKDRLGEDVIRQTIILTRPVYLICLSWPSC